MCATPPSLSLFSPYTSEREARAFARLIELSGKRETLEVARSLVSNDQSLAALARLDSLWSVIESLGWQDRFEIDLGDVTRLDYYTGLTFKIYVRDAGTKVGSGGRYDGLTASFGKSEPAIGFVLDADALTELPQLGGNDKPTGTELQGSLLTGAEPTALLREAVARRLQGQRVSLS